MEEKVSIIDHYLCIQMPKEVDHHHAVRIRETADKYLLKEEVQHIVFDFGETLFMDSSGVGVILGRLKKIKGLGGKVYIVNANERLSKMLQLSGVMAYVEVLQNEQIE